MIALRHLLPDQPLPERLRDLTIKALRLDSRAVTPGDLFLAVPSMLTTVSSMRTMDWALAGAITCSPSGG